MGKTSKESRYFLILLFSCWVLIFPTYLSFSTLDGLDIASFYTCIEDIDQGDSIPSSEKKETILVSTFCIKHILMACLPSVRIPNLLYQLTSLNSKSLILRC